MLLAVSKLTCALLNVGLLTLGSAARFTVKPRFTVPTFLRTRGSAADLAFADTAAERAKFSPENKIIPYLVFFQNYPTQ